MDEYNNPTESEEFQEEYELSHSDKAVGVLTEPAETFSQMSRFPPKVKDWFIPFLIFLILVIVSQIIQFSNPVISYESKQQQIEALEKRFDELIKDGRLSQEEADRQIENIQRMDFFALRLIGTAISVVLFFFFIAAIYFLFGRFVFRGEGSYSSALVSSGMPLYIGIIEVLVYTIAALLLERGMANASVGSFMGIQPNTGFGLLMWLINPLAIWMYIVIGVALAKMFKQNVIPFIVLVFIIYLLSNLLVYVLTS
jgi:hypothetical protein